MLDTTIVREHFPALASSAVYLDNPGGTQIAREALRRIEDYLVRMNANHGGAFATSRASDALVEETRVAMADFLNAARPEEIAFGPNMTTLTFGISRSLSRAWGPGDEIVVTRLDHDANITPWVLAAEDRGATVRRVDFDVEDCTLNMDDLTRQITPRTKLVAVGYASNAVGTINPVRRVVELAHAAGALCYVDAVQYAPHGIIDVQALDCDFLACSAYKFFGPHLGCLYGKYDLLDGLKAYKVRPAGNLPPDKFETGTQSFEAIAGTLGAVEYFQWLGETCGAEFAAAYPQYAGRRRVLKQAMAAIHAHERELARALIAGLARVPGLHVWGITDPARLDERVATVSFTLAGRHPRAVAEALARENVYVWDGNYYALAVTERLGLEDKGGMVRVGPVHYNTMAEVERVVDAVTRVAAAVL